MADSSGFGNGVTPSPGSDGELNPVPRAGVPWGFGPCPAPDAPAGPYGNPNTRAAPGPEALPPPAQRTARVAPGGLTLQDRPQRGKGLLLAPGIERVDSGALALLLP